MGNLLEFQLGDRTILVENIEEKNDYSKHRGENEGVIKKLDKAFDTLIQNEIIEHCRILSSAFEQLKEQDISPKKATAEFGLQFNAEGNIYVAKISSQSSFKVSFEWEI